MPYSARNVWTMASVAFGPAASRAGSPGATCEMVKVMASRPATISSMKAERLTMKRSMGRDGPSGRCTAGTGRTRWPCGWASPQALHVVARGRVAVADHAEDLGLVRHDAALDLFIQRLAVGPGRQRARGRSARTVPVVQEMRGVVLAPGTLVIHVGHRVRIDRHGGAEGREDVGRGLGAAPRATMLGQVSGTMRIVMFSGLRLSISNRPIWRSSSSPARRRIPARCRLAAT